MKDNKDLFFSLFLGLLFLLVGIYSNAQEPVVNIHSLKRPKLVVGIVVDQMRWDYIYRYYDRYTKEGFKRLLNDGFSCDNTMIDHLPSATAVGHATVYTGSVPAVHGIVGNEWVDQLTGHEWYCTEDTTVEVVGNGTSKAGRMSPRNLHTSTIGDELRLAQNFRSKVVGISLKDRASILPAGHTATAVFWMDDKSGEFITSDYYMERLPAWLEKFNNEDRGKKLLSQGWNTLYPIESYIQSTKDDAPWESTLSGAKAPVFPYDLAPAYERKPAVIRSTPFGNTLVTDLAKEVVVEYKLGKRLETDLLAINYASTDVVGHMYGVNSIEIEDTYLRLDRDLASLFKFLDKEIGNQEYMVFLTADHGAAHAKKFMDEVSVPTGYWDAGLEKELNQLLIDSMGVPGIVLENGKLGASYQVNFNHRVVENNNLDFGRIKKTVIDFLLKQEGVMYAVDFGDINRTPIVDRIKTSIHNSYNYKRSGSIQIIPDAGWMPSYSQKGTTHGSWNPYDTHIPLIFMGAQIKSGSTNRRISMVDIAPTISALLKITPPNGSVGKPIIELVN